MSFRKNIIKTEDKISLYKLTSEILKKQIKETTLFSEDITICFLDLETTGTNRKNDKIIEIALKIINIDKTNGNILSIEGEYESFQDPNEEIDERITGITGITNEMVNGKEINWETVNSHIINADLVLAHNASFDRAFMDRYMPLSRDKIWVCSISDIDWLGRGFVKQSLELLSIWHGFYYDSHRAMRDVDAVIHLLSHPSYKEEKPIVELIENSRKSYYKVIASKSPYNTKDILKARNYFWNGENKYWWKRVTHSQIEEERFWLTKNVYNGYFQGMIEEITPQDKYKD